MDNIWTDRRKVKENKKRKVQKAQTDLSENLLSLERAGGILTPLPVKAAALDLSIFIRMRRVA